jgi:ABC-type glycerol-3-phosphate transport system substrate-binding protein
MLTFTLSTCKRWLLAAGALLVAACTTVETQSFRVNPESSVESAQVASDADFSRYDRLHAVDMGIFFPQGAETQPEDVERIRDTFRNAFLAELEGYDIVTEPGPGAMTVQATLIDFRAAEYSDTMSVRSELRNIAAPGKIVFLMEMRDSVDNRILARAADSAKTPTIADESGETTDWTSIEEAAAHWAELFRRFLDENLGR